MTHKCSLARDTTATNHKSLLETYSSKLEFKSPRGQWDRKLDDQSHKWCLSNFNPNYRILRGGILISCTLWNCSFELSIYLLTEAHFCVVVRSFPGIRTWERIPVKYWLTSKYRTSAKHRTFMARMVTEGWTMVWWSALYAHEVFREVTRLIVVNIELRGVEFTDDGLEERTHNVNIWLSYICVYYMFIQGWF